MIIKNAIRCNFCGDEIESKHRHDYVECSRGACAVDGGHDYLRRCFKEKDCYTDISVCEPDPQNKQANHDSAATPELSDDEKIDIAAKDILERYKAAFQELAK